MLELHEGRELGNINLWPSYACTSSISFLRTERSNLRSPDFRQIYV